MSERSPSTLSARDKLDWLRLIRSENVGPVTFHRLLERFGTAKAALDALPDLARRGGRGGRIKIASKSAAEDEMARLEKLGVLVVAWGEPGYPPLLAQIEDAPPLLFVRGHPHLLTKRAIAIVGARNASINGKRFAARMAAGLGRGGLLVVSGLARGIDAAAHEGALETGTLGVVAGGVDVVYPKENAALYAALAERGAIVSEIEAGTQPQARHFPRRNRLISGIARGVVVLEAGKRSGSLITARRATDQGREVFAVPGSPMDPRSGGANELIRDGAQLVESPEQVLDALAQFLRQPLAERKSPAFKASAPPPPDETETEKARTHILASVDSVPVEVDELLVSCHQPPSAVFTALLELELAGRLERHPGNRVSLITE